MPHSSIHSQRGGTLLGFILGLVIGLTVALGVAMYVTKVPMPFSNKNLSRSAEQDAVEAQKNKDWNPNSAIQAKPASPPEGAADGAPANATTPAANTSNAPAAPATPASPAAPAVAADPLADLVKNKSLAGTPPPAATPQPAASQPSSQPAAQPAAPQAPKASNSADPFTYFVQAGAFKSAPDADAQKAKLSMMGIEAKVSEREQAGRIIYRVRSGPFDDKEQAEKIKARLDSNGMDAALVRVQK
jgi:cell division protein FtsN